MTAFQYEFASVVIIFPETVSGYLDWRVLFSYDVAWTKKAP
jgi:hypothetical protein